MTHDLAQTDELQMTHEFISNMLGVRREGVTVAARRLQDMHMISYVRGHIRILDRPQLLAHVCECYQVVKDEHSRLLG
jgi:CRP-like cAMP-binding protein